jgi:hypothetical protein
MFAICMQQMCSRGPFVFEVQCVGCGCAMFMLLAFVHSRL